MTRKVIFPKKSIPEILSDCKKPLNRRPKPFKYEYEMELILEGDPAFKPIYLLRSSLHMLPVALGLNRKTTALQVQMALQVQQQQQVMTPRNQQIREREKSEDLKEYLKRA